MTRHEPRVPESGGLGETDAHPGRADAGELDGAAVSDDVITPEHGDVPVADDIDGGPEPPVSPSPDQRVASISDLPESARPPAESPGGLPGPSGPPAGRPTAGHAADEADDLIEPAEVAQLRDRWRRIQAGFVDDPHAATAQADELVEHTIRRLTEVLHDRTSALRDRLGRGESAAETEDLRQALRGYRTVLERLLR